MALSSADFPAIQSAIEALSVALEGEPGKALEGKLAQLLGALMPSGANEEPAYDGGPDISDGEIEFVTKSVLSVLRTSIIPLAESAARLESDSHERALLRHRLAIALAAIGPNPEAAVDRAYAANPAPKPSEESISPEDLLNHAVKVWDSLDDSDQNQEEESVQIENLATVMPIFLEAVRLGIVKRWDEPCDPLTGQEAKDALDPIIDKLKEMTAPPAEANGGRSPSAL